MKKNKMSLTTELDLTREGTAEMTRWCILIALHQRFGIGAARLNKILARAEKLGQESLDVAMTVNEDALDGQEPCFAAQLDAEECRSRLPGAGAAQPPHPAGRAAADGGRCGGQHGLDAVR